jgi:hypothetical protein
VPGDQHTDIVEIVVGEVLTSRLASLNARQLSQQWRKAAQRIVGVRVNHGTSFPPV